MSVIEKQQEHGLDVGNTDMWHISLDEGESTLCGAVIPECSSEEEFYSCHYVPNDLKLNDCVVCAEIAKQQGLL